MTTEQMLARAQRRLELGYWQEALQLLEQAAHEVETEVDRAAVDLEIGKLHLALRQSSQAEKVLGRAVQSIPGNAQAHYLLGLSYRAQEQWDKAAAAFKQADQLKPDDPAILANHGWVMFQRGEEQPGRRLVERAVQLDLGRIPTLLDLAFIHAAEGNLPAAIACARHAHVLSTGKAETREPLTLLYSLREYLEEQDIIATDDHPPRTEREWRGRISVAAHPFEIIHQMAEQSRPQSEGDLEKLVDRVDRWWNTTPRPELGGISPQQARKLEPRQSQVETPPPPPWLLLDPAKTETNTLRRDMVSFLSHLHDMKYTATSSLGNLPLKAVRAINALLTNPVSLEYELGERVYKVRSVQEVWRLDFLQGLCITAELARFEPGHRIFVLEDGHTFLESAPIRQIWTLLDAWWWRTNWLWVYQWEVFEEFEGTGLPFLARTLLGSVEADTWVPIREFINSLIDMGQLDELAVNPSGFGLSSGLQRMTVDVLADFGVLEIRKHPKRVGKSMIQEPTAFRITPFGDQLLRTI